MKRFLFIVIIRIWFVLPLSVCGQDTYYLTFMLEDDFLHYNGHGTDRYYSGGLHLGVSCLRDGLVPSVHRLFLQQKIFTPTDISKTAVQYSDYPYAGLMYLQYNYSRYSRDKKYGITLKNAVGTTGKSSFAEPFQKEFHRWIGYKKPLGWANAREMGILVQTEAEGWYRLANDPWASWYGFAGMEAGTLFSRMHVGNHIQFGWRASSGIDHILGIGSPSKSKKVVLYAFFSPRLSFVVKNKLLSTGLEANPLSLSGAEAIRISPLLLQTSTGLFFQSRACSLRLAQHFNTREFAAARTHTFGEITLIFTMP